MKLQYRYKTKEEIPSEAPEGFYAPADDGTYIAQLEGAADAAKVVEFRNRNIELDKRLAAFKPLEGMDIAELLKARETVQNLDDKKLLDAGKVEEIIASRVKALADKHAETVGELTGKLSTTASQLAKVQIEGALVAEATGLGVRKGAVTDLLLRGSNVFSLDETGKPVAKDAQGNIVYSDDGTTPLTVKGYVERLAKDEQSRHLFQENFGGGGSGSGNGDPGLAKYANANPWSKEHRNLTIQSTLIAKDFPLAKRLAAAHGIEIAEGKPISQAN